jgi:hypothetical protein
MELGDRPGYLEFCGERWTAEHIARDERQYGHRTTAQQVTRYLKHLFSHGVFKVDEHSVIYSPRLVAWFAANPGYFNE